MKFSSRITGLVLSGCLLLMGSPMRGAAQDLIGDPSSVGMQEIRVDAGVGWGIPLSDVQMQASIPETGQQGPVSVNISSGANLYLAVGFARSISDWFAIGLRGRVQSSQGDENPLDVPVVSEVLQCEANDCTISNPLDASLRTATLEGRIFVRTIDWVEPYFLVGLGAVQTQVDGSRAENSNGDVLQVEEVDVLDAGGDVGFGASVPLTPGLSVETEIRVTGSLPGGKESTLTVLPLSVGLSYGF